MLPFSLEIITIFSTPPQRNDCPDLNSDIFDLDIDKAYSMDYLTKFAK
jgi:hypothetical protein